MSIPVARAAGELAALFPPGVIGVQLRAAPQLFAGEPPGALRALLTPPEWQSVAHCHERRIRDFVAGRVCAHAALAALGFERCSVLTGAEREPLWPAGLAGSITHTEGYSAAVIGHLHEVGSLGVDAERIEAVPPALWRQICTAGELAALMQRAGEQRARAATLTFAAKEAFYKSQFVLVRERLEFDAVRVRVGEVLAERGEFWIEPCRELRLAGANGAPLPATGWPGRFLHQDGVLIAGLALPVRSPGGRPARQALV